MNNEIDDSDEIHEAMNLSALIEDNEEPENKYNETSEQEEDRKHKTYFWLGVCVFVAVIVGVINQ